MYTLNNTDIDRVCRKLEADFAEHRISDPDGTRIRLSVEEILLKYAERFGCDTEFDVKTEKHFGSLRIVLSIRCDTFDPIDSISEEEIIIIALDVITDRISTPTQVSVGQLELIQIASSLGSLDIETLRNNTNL